MIKHVTHVVTQLRSPALVQDTADATADAPATNPSQQAVAQLLLFGEVGGTIQRKRQAKKKAKRIKGKQYKIQFKTRLTPRKIAYRPHATKEASLNEESWSDQGMRYLHSVLLSESLKTLRALCVKGSPRAAEIIAWMMRNEPTATFSFEECCRLFQMEVRDPDDNEMHFVGQQDPEVLRCQAKLWIKSAYGADLPHASVLRQAIRDAEGGDPDAIEWILNDEPNPLSFNECADALGFEPDDARREIKLPTVSIESNALERGIQRIIDRIFGHSSSAAIAA